MRSRPYGAGNDTVSRIQSCAVASGGALIRSARGVRSYEKDRVYAAKTSSSTGSGSGGSTHGGTFARNVARAVSAGSYFASRKPIFALRSQAERGSAAPNMYGGSSNPPPSTYRRSGSLSLRLHSLTFPARSNAPKRWRAPEL